MRYILNAKWWTSNQPTVVVSTLSKWLSSRSRRNTSISHSPPCSLLYLLPLPFFLELLPWISSVIACYLEMKDEWALSSSSCFWTEFSVTATESKQEYMEQSGEDTRIHSFYKLLMVRVLALSKDQKFPGLQNSSVLCCNKRKRLWRVVLKKTLFKYKSK